MKLDEFNRRSEDILAVLLNLFLMLLLAFSIVAMVVFAIYGMSYLLAPKVCM